MFRRFLLAGLFLSFATTAMAQNQVVQQPVVRQFRTSTSVSVPDQGRAFLGGVNSGAIGSNRYGPFRGGTNSGREYSSATQSASVYIHDFEAMDGALLSARRDTPTRRASKPLSPRAAHAWRTLAARHGNR